MSNKELLRRAGKMADLAISLVGGNNLHGQVLPAHPDHFSDIARQLRLAAEEYNSGILEASTTRENLSWALCSIMDGIKEHEIHEITGLPEGDCEKVWSVYTQALNESRQLPGGTL
jgi:hypothetical protein